jgi:predicted nucleotidyltransferase
VAEAEYERLVDAARSDERVVGLVLTGSRGRGPFARDDSDWDVRLVTRDDAEASEYATPHGSPVEVVVLKLGEFERAGEPGSPTEWDRYSYAHAQVAIDKLDGRIARLVAAKGVLGPDAAREIAERELGAYVNSCFRSLKNHARGLTVEAHLDAAESVSPFLTSLFALHERVRPFNKFLRWELATHPLPSRVWEEQSLVLRLARIVATGDPAAQRQLFRDAEHLARDRGLARVIDGWEPDLPLLRGDAT